MSDEKDRPGLGKIIYSINDSDEAQPAIEKKVENAEVEEASEESFPASDSPGYSGGTNTESS